MEHLRVTTGPRLMLIGWGAAAAAAVGVGLVRADALGSVGPQWTLTFATTYLVGVWVCLAQPDNRAAVRLLVFGCAALTFLAVSVGLLVEAQDGVVRRPRAAWTRSPSASGTSCKRWPGVRPTRVSRGS